ncbi:MAG: glycosyltransferase family 4 protein [Bacillota bacterium]|nr:MAG: glycosyl transferase family 1 [Bacillota bacterium]
MRIVMLSWEYPPVIEGGLARHVHGLATALARRGLRVHIITRAGGGLPDYEENGTLSIQRVHPYLSHALDFPGWAMHLNFAMAEAGIRYLRAQREPVILHAHDWLSAYAGTVLKHGFCLPLVATVHATEHGRMSGIHHAGHKYIHDVEWWLTYQAWQVIVCSHAMAEEVRRLFCLPADKSVPVIPNGIDLPPDPEGPLPPRERLAPPGWPLIYFLGRLVPEKGAGVLLEALPRVVERFPHLRLVIAGRGPWEGELRERVWHLGLQDRVHFAGFLNDGDRWALFRYADLAVVPSTYEPFGIVALEAMAAGTPLVVSDVGGMAEIVEHGVDGRKALPGHPDSLADQILAALHDPAGSRQMAARARAKVLARYTWDRVAEATEKVYRQVLAEWAASPWGMAASPGDPPFRLTVGPSVSPLQ